MVRNHGSIPNWNSSRGGARLELNDMKIFATVARFSSLTLAAAQLGYVQSHISKRISKLEQELNCKLLARSNRGVQLLPEGEKLLSYCLEINKITQQLEADFNTSPSHLRIGATEAVSKNYLSDLFYKPSYNIYTEKIPNLITMFQSGSLDMLMVNQVIEQLDYVEKDQFPEPLSWIGASHSDIHNIEQQNIVIVKDPHCPYRNTALDYVNKHNVQPHRIIEVNGMGLLLEMILHNAAISVLPTKFIQKNNLLEPINSQPLTDTIIYVYSHLHKGSIKKWLSSEVQFL